MTKRTVVLFVAFAAAVIMAWLAGGDHENRVRPEGIWYCVGPNGRGCGQAIDLEPGFLVTNPAQREGLCEICRGQSPAQVDERLRSVIDDQQDSIRHLRKWFCTDCQRGVDMRDGFTVVTAARQEGVCAACAVRHWDYFGVGSTGFKGWMHSLREGRYSWRLVEEEFEASARQGSPHVLCCGCGADFGPASEAKGYGRCKICGRPICNDCGSDSNGPCPGCERVLGIAD